MDDVELEGLARNLLEKVLRGGEVVEVLKVFDAPNNPDRVIGWRIRLLPAEG